ncbi:MAG: mandelate racemase/muconate lactonizing enzyme family protein [Acidobacteria bacterium]|nr:mandelate racemase/muconate lactonizing enzyme family protein [Acidobacteriota bacterium]
MRITKVEVIPTKIPFNALVRENMLENYRRENVDRPYYSPWVVRMYTDEGLVGLGETNHDARELLKKCVGRSPAEFLHDDSLRGAVTAIYDLVAQAAGVPVSRLFSPSPRARVQQIWWSHCLRPKLLQAEAKRGIALGYTVHKIKARLYEDPVEQMAALADVVPQDYSVCIDANSSFQNPARALSVAEALKKHTFVKGFEEPIPSTDLEGYRTLHGKLPFRLAVHWEAVDTRAFVLERLVDAFVVEDWLWGKAMLTKVGVTDYSRQRLWVENGLFTGISQVFQAHQAAAFPNFEYTISLTHIGEDDLVVEPFTMEKGLYKVPTKPGLGITLDEAALEKYRTG